MSESDAGRRWPAADLAAIGDATEIAIAPRRADGSLRRPVPVWVVRAGDHLYVRSYLVDGAAWYRAARAHGAGRVRAGGSEREVAFVAEANPAVNDQVDAAYRAKYGRHGASYVASMVAPAARATTLKLVPGGGR